MPRTTTADTTDLVHADEALQRSLNVPMVRMLKRAGLHDVPGVPGAGRIRFPPGAAGPAGTEHDPWRMRRSAGRTGARFRIVPARRRMAAAALGGRCSCRFSAGQEGLFSRNGVSCDAHPLRSRASRSAEQLRLCAHAPEALHTRPERATAAGMHGASAIRPRTPWVCGWEM